MVASALPPRPLAWLTDASVLTFAAWSLLCHVTVAVGGSLPALVLAMAVATPAIAWAVLSGRPSSTSSNPSPAVAEPGARGWLVLLPLAASGPLIARLPPSLALTSTACGLALLAAWDARRPRTVGSTPEPTRSIWLLVLCTLIAIAAAVSLHRPDRDDAYYLGLAATVADQPGEPLLQRNPVHPERLIRPSDRLRAFEVLLGAISWASGMSVIEIDHFLVPVVGAVLLIAAQARLLRRLAPERWLPCLVVLVILLLTVGGEHRWYGNFALVRLWQGKSLLLWYLLPLATVYGLDFGRQPSSWGFVRLLAAHIAGMGLSPPGLWMVPLATGLAVASAAQSWRPLVMAPLASLYSLGWGLWLQGEMGSELTAGAGAVTGEALTADAGTLVFGSGPLRIAALVTVGIAWWTCRQLAARRFCLLAPLVVAIMLHPLTAHLLAHHVVHASIFWRLFWMLPVPAFLALVLTVPYSGLGRGLARHARLALTAALVIAFVAIVPDRWLASPANQTQLQPFQLKVPAEDYAAARLLVHHVAAGDMVLVPEDVATWVATFHHPPRPLMVRAQYLKVGSPQERSHRISLAWQASVPADDPLQLQHFMEAVRDRRPAGLCVHTGPAARAEALRSLDYRQAGTVGRWEVWTSSKPRSSSRPKREAAP